MQLFITGLVVSLIFLILCIFFAVKAYKRKTKTQKVVDFNSRRNRDTSNRKKDNYSLFLSLCSAIFSILVMLFTLFNAVPAPTIYPLDNEAKVYNETTEAIISTIGFPLFKTYYSLDGSAPEDGYVYESPITITKTTTVSAKTKFLIFWSGLSKNTFRFGSAQNIIVNNVDNNADDSATIKDIFTYVIITIFLLIILVLAIRGELNKDW